MPEYQDITFDEGLARTEAQGIPVITPKELGKHEAIGVRVKQGDAGNRNVISAIHSQRPILLGEKQLRKSFAGAERKGKEVPEGDTASALLSLEIFNNCKNKPTLVTSTIMQDTRELNRTRLDQEDQIPSYRTINAELFTNEVVIRTRNGRQRGLKDFLLENGIGYDLTAISPEVIENAWDKIDPRTDNFERIDAMLAAMKSWINYHTTVNQRLLAQEPTQKPNQEELIKKPAICLEIHTAFPNKPEGIEVIIGTHYGLSCDFETHVNLYQALAKAGIGVHDTLTELAFFTPKEELQKLYKKRPESRASIEAFRKYVTDYHIDYNFYHKRDPVKKIEGLAGTELLPYRRRVGGQTTSAFQLEIPRNTMLDNFRRNLIAKTLGKFLDQIANYE